MKKVLFLATYGDFLATFEYSNITIWKSLGASVYCGSNFNDKKYNLKTKKLDDLGIKRYERRPKASPPAVSAVSRMSSRSKRVRGRVKLFMPIRVPVAIAGLTGTVKPSNFAV